MSVGLVNSLSTTIKFFSKTRGESGVYPSQWRSHGEDWGGLVLTSLFGMNKQTEFIFPIHENFLNIIFWNSVRNLSKNFKISN